MTALRQQYSFHAEKRYRQKKPPPYISNTCSSATGYHPKSSVIETLDSRPNSHANYAKPWASRRTFPRRITPELMDNRSDPISGWNNISEDTSMSANIT